MIAVVCRPAERKLAQIAGADDKTARLVCEIEQRKRAHSRLRVFIRNVRRVVLDVAQVTVRRAFYIDCGQFESERVA